MAMRWRRFGSALVLRGCAMVCAAVGQFLLGRLLIGRCGEEGQAAWTLIQGVAVLLSMLDLAVGNALVRQVHGLTDPGPTWAAGRVLLRWVGIASCAGLAAAAWAAPAILRLHGEDADACTLLALLLALSSLFRYPLGLGAWALYRSEDPRPSALTELATAGMRPLVAVAALGAGAGLVGAGVAWCASELAIYAVVRILAPSWSHATGPADGVVRLARDAAGMAGASLASSMPMLLAPWLIGWQARVEDVNRWQFSGMLPQMLLRLLYLPITTSYPALVRGVAAHGLGQQVRRWRAPLVVYLVANLAGAALLTAANEVFVAWWVGPGFFAGPLATAMLGLWCVASALRTSLWTGVCASSEHRASLVLAHAAELALLVATAGLVLGRWGLGGFAAAMATCQLLVLIWCIVVLALVAQRRW